MAKWEISWGDGYYPYCSNCGCEPPYPMNINLDKCQVCPKCGATITNCDEFKEENRYGKKPGKDNL